MAKAAIKDAAYNTIDDVPMENAFIRASPGAEAANSRVYARQLSTGSMRGEQSLSDGNVRIDSSNRRILIYDEDGNARVLIGYDAGGF